MVNVRFLHFAFDLDLAVAKFTVSVQIPDRTIQIIFTESNKMITFVNLILLLFDNR